MLDIDLAIITRSSAIWRTVRGSFGRLETIESEPGPGAADDLLLGILRPDFGPGYRALLVRLGPTGSVATIQRMFGAFEPPYTIALGLGRAVPGRGIGPGDVVLSKSVPGYAWNRSVGRGVGSGAEPEAQVDNVILRGALGLDAVDQRWTREGSASRPASVDRAPRLHAGPIASTTEPITADAGFDQTTIKGLGRRWPRLLAVEGEGLDIATSICTFPVPRRTVLMAAITGELTDPEPDEEAVRYAAINAASLLRCWIRNAWPTRPVAAATGQTPKGIRAGNEQPRRSRTGPVNTLLPGGVKSAPSVPVVRSRRPGAEDESARPRGRPRPRSGPASMAGNRPATRSGPIATIEGGRPRPRTRSGPMNLGPAASGERTGSGAVSLRAQLAQLYPTAEDTRRVLEDVGLSTENIDFAGGADVRWFRILEVVRRRSGGIDRLLKVLVRDGH